MMFALITVSLSLDVPSLHIILQFIGVLGSFIYVSVFFLVQSGKLCGNGIVYTCYQLCAATCVAASLTTAFNLAAFLVQVSFITIALYGIWFRSLGPGRIYARFPRITTSMAPGSEPAIPQSDTLTETASMRSIMGPANPEAARCESRISSRAA